MHRKNKIQSITYIHLEKSFLTGFPEKDRHGSPPGGYCRMYSSTSLGASEKGWPKLICPAPCNTIC